MLSTLYIFVSATYIYPAPRPAPSPSPAPVCASSPITRYDSIFIYYGSGKWSVSIGSSNNGYTELKNIGPTQSVLCSDNHNGGAASCTGGPNYFIFTSDATNDGKNCAYL